MLEMTKNVLFASLLLMTKKLWHFVPMFFALLALHLLLIERVDKLTAASAEGKLNS